jgi:four helix bundle protein
MEGKAFSFMNLNAYIEAKSLVKLVYAVINTLPQEERYALADQLRRAVISVPSNVVEGMNRISDKEKSHFLEIAYASLMEVYCQIDIATDLGYIAVENYAELEHSINIVAKLISGLRKSVHRVSQPH